MYNCPDRIIIVKQLLREQEMKQTTPLVLDNAFLKIRVGTHPQKLFFKDVKNYRKFIRKTTPALPLFKTSKTIPLPTEGAEADGMGEEECPLWEETSTEERQKWCWCLILNLPIIKL